MLKKLKIAIIAGEVSGDLLGADLLKSLREQIPEPFDLIGVGGEAMTAEGLASLYDYTDLSVMGFTQVISNLPRLLSRIKETKERIIQAKPDILIIIDSPDFTHRVAKAVRHALPDVPIVNYVSPSVWAWKEYRAERMLGYVDHVLAVLPFEPEVIKRLGGPPTTYVGHRMVTDKDVISVRATREKALQEEGAEKTLLLLPGSRRSEVTKLMPVLEEVAFEFERRNGGSRFVIPAVARQEELIRDLLKTWRVSPEVVVGTPAKWSAFKAADAAVAASGTVILELALCGVPVVSIYESDWLIKLVQARIKIWTAALPNLVADYVVVPEQINGTLRAGTVTRWLERLSTDTSQRAAMLEGFDLVWNRMQTDIPAGRKAATIVLDLLNQKRP